MAAHGVSDSGPVKRFAMNIGKKLYYCLAALSLFRAAGALAAAVPTFDKDVAPIVFQNCAVCHRPGEVAPFPLLTYHDVSKRGKQIARVIGDGIMPPWKAEAGFGEGNAADLPAKPKFPDGWMLGTPDVVLEPDEDYTLAAEGGDLYRCFVV